MYFVSVEVRHSQPKRRSVSQETRTYRLRDSEILEDEQILNTLYLMAPGGLFMDSRQVAVYGLSEQSTLDSHPPNCRGGGRGSVETAAVFCHYYVNLCHKIVESIAVLWLLAIMSQTLPKCAKVKQAFPFKGLIFLEYLSLGIGLISFGA